MSVKTFALFGSGEYGARTPELPAGTFIIAADGGLSFLTSRGVTPHLIVGDFDSYGGPLPEGVEVIRHPVMKDQTDMELAVREALRRGAGRLLLYGGLGGRLDHTLANLQLLVMLARRGVEGYLVGKNETATALSRRAARFSPDFTGTVSVFACGEAVVSETGLLYRLHQAALTDERPLGVSNEFTGARAEIAVHQGTALLLWGAENRGLPQIIEV